MDQKHVEFIQAIGTDHAKLGAFIDDPDKHLDDAGITCPDERHLVKVTIASSISKKLTDPPDSFAVAY